MTNKNILKILVIMIAVLSLFAVSCRKSGGGGDPTPIDPTKSMTGNLLIVSVDGRININSIPLRFAGANATVAKVEVEKDTTLNLDTTNFIVENNALKLTKFDLSTEEAAVSNKVTLTFDLSASSSSPITRYTDTADIFVGKYSNIYTNTFDTFTNLVKIDGDSFADANNFRQGDFDFSVSQKTFFKDNTFSITNNKPGEASNNIVVNEFISILEKNIKDNTIFTTYFNDVKVSFVSIDETSQFIATFKVDLTSKSALFETPYTSYNFIFNALKGKWVQ